MEEDIKTTLTVTNEAGKQLTIDVIDIFSIEDNPTEYIIYELNGDVYASILVEDEESFELKTIENKDDYAKIMARINELTAE